MIFHCLPSDFGAGAQRFSTGEAPWSTALVRDAIAVVAGMALRRFSSFERGRSAGRPRVPLDASIAIYLAHTLSGESYASLGRLYGYDRTTIRRLCHRVEDLRDAPSFDTSLAALERGLRPWMAVYAGCVLHADLTQERTP